MKVNSLTDAQVRGLKAGTYVDGENLLIRVSPNGVKTWTYKYKDGNGKSTALALGRYPKVGLAEARALKEKCKKLIGDGLHPKLALNDDGPIETFGQVAEMFITHHSKTIKYGDGLRNEIERNLLPTIGNIRIAEVKPIDVLRALKPVIERGSLVVARRYAVRARQVCAHALNLGLIPYNQLLTVTKVIPAKKGGNYRALKPEQLGELVQGLAKADISVITRNLAMFTLLTATRASESAGAKWSEIDLPNRTWTIPASRMKMGREHRIPLSDGAVKILEFMQTIRQNDYAFPGRAITSHANASSVNVALRRAGIDSTFHGFRSLFSTYCHERSDCSSDVIENALAHTTGGVRGAYLRSTFWDKRVELAAWWDAEVTKASATE
jgi:integrase